MYAPMAFLCTLTSTMFAENVQASKGQALLKNAFIMFPTPFLIPVMKKQPTLL